VVLKVAVTVVVILLISVGYWLNDWLAARHWRQLERDQKIPRHTDEYSKRVLP
jgi:hypothetical protein